MLKSFDRMNDLALCSSAQDLLSAQTTLARESFEQIVEDNQRLAQRTIEVAQEISQATVAQYEKAAGLSLRSL